MTGTFTLIAFDEDEPRVRKGPTGELRVVCRTGKGGKIAIWGSDDSRRNIDAVLMAGLPCTIECGYTESLPRWATKYGHTQWVEQHSHLRVALLRKSQLAPSAPTRRFVTDRSRTTLVDQARSFD